MYTVSRTVIVLASLYLATLPLFAIPAFPNADFESGTFANWPVHEQWNLQGGLDTGIYDTAIAENADQTLPELTGYYSASSRNQVEWLTYFYSRKEGIIPFPRRLVSAPFVVSKPYLTLLLTGTFTDDNIMLGMDFNQDGTPEVRLTDAAIAAIRQRCPIAGVYSLDLREYVGKTGALMVTVNGGTCSLDRLRLEDHPTPLIQRVTTTQADTSGRVQCQIINPYVVTAKATLHVTVLDYYGKKVADTRQPIQVNAQETTTATATFPIKLGPDYRITAELLTDDGTPLQIKRARFRAERLQADRPKVLIDQDWEVTTSTDEQLVLPPADAAWKPESPVKPCGSYGYRSKEWLKYQDQAQTWYRRSFTYPSPDLGNAGVYLRLDGGGNGLFSVFVNGREIATKNISRYSQEAFNLTSALSRGQNDLIVRFRNPDRYLRAADKSFLQPVAEYIGIPTGFWGHVYLEGRPAVNVGGVLIDPSVANGMLKLRITVANTSNASATPNIGASVFDANGNEVLRCKPVNTSIAAGEQTEVTITQPWAKPILWSTETPNLLRLRLTATTGSAVDTSDTRFGFREFTTRGKDFLLNGHPLTILDHTGGAPEAYHFRKVVNGQNADRQAPAYSYDGAAMCDEEGLLTRMIFYEAGPPMRADISQDIWGALEQWNLNQVRYLYNNPSMWSWMIGNELGGMGYLRGQMVETFRPLYTHMIKEIQALDPMRPVTSDGDLDFFGAGQIWNAHYPFEYGQSYVLPNGAYFVAPDVQLMDWFPHPAYDGNKPVFFGEVFSGGAMGPDYFAPFGGDRVYDPIGLFDTWKAWAILRTRAYRDQRVIGYEPFEPYTYINDFFPVDLYPKEYNHHFFGGTRLTRTIQVFNAIQAPQALTLHWQLGDMARGTVPVTLAPGETREVPLNIDLPAVTQRRDVQFSLVLLKPDGTKLPRCGNWEGTYSIFPKTPLTGTVAVAGLDEKTLTMLHESGLTAVPITSAAALSSYRLLVTSGALLREDLPGVRAWVRNGGHVLLLNQQDKIEKLPFISPSDSSSRSRMKQQVAIEGLPLLLNEFPDTRAYPIAPANPLLAGMQSDDLCWWGADNFVTGYSYTKPTQGNFQVLCETGDASGLPMTPLVELTEGQGSIIGCTLLLVEKYRDEPTVGVLLNNIVKQAQAQPTITAKRAGVLASDQLTAYLHQQGWSVDDLAEVSAPSLTKYDLLWIDAGIANVDVPAMKTFVENGGTLVLSRLDPKVAQTYQSLIPFAFTLTKAPRNETYGGEVKRVGFPELLNGISNYDLFWKRGTLWRDNPDLRITALPVEFAVTPEANAPVHVLTTPGVLLEAVLGRGKVIVSQFRWEESLEAENRAPRILNTLLHNLHVANTGTTVQQEHTTTTHPVALPTTRALRAGLIDGITDAISKFPTGEVSLGGATFKIPVTGNNVALLGAPKSLPELPTRLTIPVNGTADRLWFWHSCALGFVDYDKNKKVWEYRVTLREGDQQYTEVIPVRYSHEVYEYLGVQPAVMDNAAQVTVSAQAGLSSYVMSWANPRPNAVIERIEVVGTDEKMLPLILGITATTNQKSAQASTRRRDGLWSVRPQRFSELVETGHAWAICGPFDNDPHPRGGFDTAYQPETRPIDVTGFYWDSRSHAVPWRKYVQPIPQNPSMDDTVILESLDMLQLSLVADPQYWTSYAYTKIYAPAEQQAIIAFGSDDGAKIWVNEALVHEKWVQRSPALGQDMIPVTLKAGWNTVLIKIVNCSNSGGYAFDLKAYDPATIAAWEKDWQSLAPRPSLPYEYDAFQK